MVLAIDPALTTGWAYRSVDGHLFCGVWDIRSACDPSPGKEQSIMPAMFLRDAINEMNKRDPISHLIIEKNVFLQGMAATWIQFSLRTAAGVWAQDKHIGFQEVGSTTWKKELFGRQLKPPQYHRAAIEKWPNLSIKTEDEAAALWLLGMEKRTK